MATNGLPNKRKVKIKTNENVDPRAGKGTTWVTGKTVWGTTGLVFSVMIYVIA